MKNETVNEQGLATVTYKLEGLNCACEGQIVEKKLKKLKGVGSFSLNPITFKMKINYDPTLVTTEDIEKAISKGGAKAVPLT